MEDSKSILVGHRVSTLLYNAISLEEIFNVVSAWTDFR